MGVITYTAKEKKKRKDNAIKITVVLIVLAIITALSICLVLNRDDGFKSGIASLFSSKNESETKNESGDKEMNNTGKYSEVKKNPIVTMEMNDGKTVKIELYPQIAPTTVENFISLIKQGFYDGLTFHRVIPDFMAQGGDPSGDGTGGPGYSIFGEFSENGFENNLSHEIGVISMARANEPNSAGSQFFIVTDENSYLSLDGKYAGFGKVLEGMDVVYEIVNTETIRKDLSDELMNEIVAAGGQITTLELYERYMKESTEITTPKNPPTIKTMTVDTFGYEYDEPEKM